MNKKFFWLPAACLLLGMGSLAAEGTQELILKPVFKDIPSFKRPQENEYGKQYQLKMVKLKNNPQIKQPPLTEATVLYYGEITLGSPPQTYGILVDFEGKDKLLWADSDGDGDFSKEQAYTIFKSDRFPSVNVYYSPVPIVFQVKYEMADHTYQTQLQFNLPYLLISKSRFQDHFYLQNLTWFAGVLSDTDQEFNIALVDTNDNGCFNEPEDLFFIDRDFDLIFSNKEENIIKKLKSFKFKSKTKYQIDLQYAPEKIIIKKDDQ